MNETAPPMPSPPTPAPPRASPRDRWELRPGDLPSARVMRVLDGLDPAGAGDALGENPVFRYLSMKHHSRNAFQRAIRMFGGFPGRYRREKPVFGLPRGMLRDLAMTPATGREILRAAIAHHLRRTGAGAIAFQIAAISALWWAAGLGRRPDFAFLRWAILFGVGVQCAQKAPSLALAMARPWSRIAVFHEAGGSQIVAAFKRMLVMLPFIVAAEILFMLLPFLIGVPPFGNGVKWGYALPYGALLFAVYLFLRVRAPRNYQKTSAEVDKLLAALHADAAAKR